MRSLHGLVIAVALGLVCAGGCELVTGFTGDVKLGAADGGGTGASATSSANATSSGSSSGSTSSTASGGANHCADAGSCGANCPTKCPDGATCAGDGDCINGDCFGGVCVSCMDGKKDGTETDVDCGGSCVTKCADLQHCAGDGDCINKDCFGGVCVSCMDGVTDGKETDIDCGGGCSACVFGNKCKVAGDCASGFCVNGTCGADTLAMGQDNPVAIVVDTANLYWVTSGSTSAATGTVMKLPLGSTTVVPLAQSQSQPSALAIDATYVYWCNRGDGSVWKAKIADGTQTNLATNQSGGVSSIVISGATLYWGIQGFGYGAGVLNQQPLGSTMVTPDVTGISPVNMVAGVNSDTGIYYTNYASPDPKQWTINKYVPVLDYKLTLVTGEGPTGVAVDAQNLYWAGSVSSGSAIRTQPLAGGAAMTIAPVTQQPLALVVDSTHVYWTQGAAGGSVMKAPLTGTTTPSVLASGQNSPVAIAVDATYVYWTNVGDGTVNRILK